MDIPLNQLKRALRDGRRQIGLWSALSSHVSVEVLAGSGFDWLLLDTEHSPNELTMVYGQLQAMAGTGTAAVVRPVWNDMVVIKRLLDIGVQTLLVPYVQTAEEAARAAPPAEEVDAGGGAVQEQLPQRPRLPVGAVGAEPHEVGRFLVRPCEDRARFEFAAVVAARFEGFEGFGGDVLDAAPPVPVLGEVTHRRIDDALAPFLGVAPGGSSLAHERTVAERDS